MGCSEEERAVAKLRGVGHSLHGALLAWLVAALMGGCSLSPQPPAPIFFDVGAVAPPPAAADAGVITAPIVDPLAHCRSTYAVDARDLELPSAPVRYDLGSDRFDMLLPDAVRAWMSEHQWLRMYDAWHGVRRFDSLCRESNTLDDEANPCAYARQQVEARLRRAPIQECAPGDGVASLMMHRQLIDLVKFAFPTHAALFAGFDHIPRSLEDPENPLPGVPIAWTSEQLSAIERLEHIEEHVAEFADEDALGLFIECKALWTLASPRVPQQDPSAGIERDLYNAWTVIASPAELGSTRANVTNYNFWKIHGFFDDVWERYRRARGLAASDASYASAYVEQCDELHALASHLALQPEPVGSGTHGGLPMETGEFAQNVRPLLEGSCASCHGAANAAAGLTLGGSGVSSAAVLAGIVGVRAQGGEYALIEPGSVERSWIYLKASGQAAQVACERACNRGIMPPSGQPGLSAEQLAVLAQWIGNGAKP